MRSVTQRDIRKLQRDVSEATAAINRIRTEEDYPHRDAQLQARKPMTITYGTSANRPQASYLTHHGVQSHLYFATDTFVLSAWTGTAWKSVTLA
jgi:hypothetical protein